MARRSKSSRNGSRKDSGDNSNPPQRRHQRQRGHPDPDAEIVALPPSMLMDEERFICNLCAKVFVREQNLKVHARKHHIPSQLKKKCHKGSPCKKAYICPIPTCRHHDPKHALSNITGIKKHYGRAHSSTKRFACALCDKKYAVEADLKAHAKLHLKDDKGAGTACCRARAEDVWCEGLEELGNPCGGRGSGIEDEDAGNNDNGVDDNDDIALSFGVSEQPQDVYVPQFDIAPNYQEETEQGQAAKNARRPLDLNLELMESLPVGQTGMLANCATPGDKEAPAGAVNSAPDLDAFYAREAAMTTVDLNLTSSSFGAYQDSDAVNHGTGMLESLAFPAAERQYCTPDTPSSGQQESAATDLVQRAVMNVGQNATVTPPIFLPNVDALQMPHMMMIPSMGNYYYPVVVPNQAAMSTLNPPFSAFAPILGGAVLMNVNNNAIVGSANTNLQRRELGTGGSFVLGIPSVCAPQQQQVAPAPGLCYASILGGGAGIAMAAQSQMNQPSLGMMMHTAPQPAADLANQYSNGSDSGPRMDLFGASGESTNRRFEEQGTWRTFDPTASSSGDLNPSFPYIGLQGGNQRRF